MVAQKDKLINYILFKFVNKLLKQGKKIKYINYLNNVLYMIFQNLKLNPYYVLLKAVNNVSPLVKLKKKKIAGRYVSIPINLSKKQSISYGINLILLSLSKNNSLEISLYNEIVNSYYNKSLSLKKREDLYKLCLENKHNIRFI